MDNEFWVMQRQYKSTGLIYYLICRKILTIFIIYEQFYLKFIFIRKISYLIK